ncbi:hypothetical protein [Herbaspirillum sp. VT-16-41]|uniref:hypothetical protein n=1 Tax=Herbaspirillum sp. VT-16-41 TaxID=1953765 RepID=UPI000981E445|nr:hypothetical protein [Herbaspirillum sp. VT-16-41]ONN64430.1 hypothetical protein BTM36_20060 [Herbaspirillum sp. VT-16-41]
MNNLNNLPSKVLSRPHLLRWSATLLILALVLCGWSRQQLQAATTARLAVSAVVPTRCNVVVQIVNGSAAVSNTCGGVMAGSPDGRALLLVDQRERSVLVVY